MTDKQKIKVGDKVSLPRHYIYGRRHFKVVKINYWGYTLEFLGGDNKGEIIEFFDEEELIKLKKWREK